MALISLGLMTTVQPAASAVASLLQMKPAFEFQGVMRPATPTGSITTWALPTWRVSGERSSVFAASRKDPAPYDATPLARDTAPPYPSLPAALLPSARPAPPARSPPHPPPRVSSP